jgi:hypothetical protein
MMPIRRRRKRIGEVMCRVPAVVHLGEHRLNLALVGYCD